VYHPLDNKSLTATHQNLMILKKNEAVSGILIAFIFGLGIHQVWLEKWHNLPGSLKLINQLIRKNILLKQNEDGF
jgi:hypothetical protein